MIISSFASWCDRWLPDYQMLNQHSTPGINPTWSWHLIIYCGIQLGDDLLRISASMFRDIQASSFPFQNFFKVITPNLGFELRTPRLTVECSTDSASQAPLLLSSPIMSLSGFATIISITEWVRKDFFYSSFLEEVVENWCHFFLP